MLTIVSEMKNKKTLLSVSGSIFTLLLMLLYSCGEKKPEKAVKQNEVEYSKIYVMYGKVPFETTRKSLDTLVARFPNYPLAWAFYGRILYDLNQNDSAIQAYKKAVSFDSTFVIGYQGIGGIYNQIDNSDSALYYLQKAITLRDSSSFTLTMLAKVYLKKNEPEKSKVLADKLYARNETTSLQCFNLSYIYHKLKEEDRSALQYQKAIALGIKDTLGASQVLTNKLRIEDYYKRNNY